MVLTFRRGVSEWKQYLCLAKDVPSKCNCKIAFHFLLLLKARAISAGGLSCNLNKCGIVFYSD